MFEEVDNTDNLCFFYMLLSRFSYVWLCVTPETAAHQAPLSLGFSGQEHWNGLPFPSPVRDSEKWKWSRLVMSHSSRRHGLQPTRLLCPWNSPGKSTGVGCHCLLQFQHAVSIKKANEICCLLFYTKSLKLCMSLTLTKPSQFRLVTFQEVHNHM